MPDTLDLVLPRFVPDSRLSLNGRHRTHWSVIRKLRADAAWAMAVALGFTGGGRQFERAKVEITFVYPTRRRRDPDGLAGLAKPLLDTLVTFGTIPDDDVEHVELTVRAVVERKTTETRLTLRATETA